MEKVDKKVARFTLGSSGDELVIRLILKGDYYGGDLHIVHDKIDPIVEFYYPRRRANKFGRLIESYSLSELVKEVVDRNNGLYLRDDINHWEINVDMLKAIVDWARQSLDSNKLKGSDKEFKTELEVKKLHSYFIKEPLCKYSTAQKNVENLLNWALGEDSIDPLLHEQLFKFLKEKYKVEKEAKAHMEQEIPGPFRSVMIINYHDMLEALIELLNHIAPEDTQLVVYNGYYQFREFAQFGPPNLD